MRLHANAALSLRQRRRMVSLVVETAGRSGRLRPRFRPVRRPVRSGCPGSGRAQRAVCWIAARRRIAWPTAPTSARSRRSRRCAGCGSAARRSPSCSDGRCRRSRGSFTRIGMGRLGRLGWSPRERYERARPGELIHIDVKKLGRIQRRRRQADHRRSTHYTGSCTDAAGRRRGKAGWDYVHIAIDDCHPPGLRRSARRREGHDRDRVPAPRHRVLPPPRHQRRAGLTDNGSPYVSTIHAIACRTLGIRHLRTRPDRPQTNGKAERFIRTMLGGWAYGAIYGSSQERTAALDGWLWHYNHHRRHEGVKRQTPITRLNNLLGSYS